VYSDTIAFEEMHVKQFRVRFYKHTTTADRHSITVNANSPNEARNRVRKWGKGELQLSHEEEVSEELEREGDVIESEFNALEQHADPYAVVDVTPPGPAPFIVRSSYADIYCDRTTGAIIKIDYEAMGGRDEWDDVDRFDPRTFEGTEDDSLRVGFWTKDGNYAAPLSEKELNRG
jgi:hypothetical protein